MAGASAPYGLDTGPATLEQTSGVCGGRRGAFLVTRRVGGMRSSDGARAPAPRRNLLADRAAAYPTPFGPDAQGPRDGRRRPQPQRSSRT